jgi:WD40 repeat protein
MYRRVFLIILFGLLNAFPFGVNAQGTKTYTTLDGTVILTYPADWRAEHWQDAAVVFTNNASAIRQGLPVWLDFSFIAVYDPIPATPAFFDYTLDSLTSLIARVFANTGEVVQQATPVDTTLAGQPAAYADVSGSDYQGIAIVRSLDPVTSLFGFGVTTSGDIEALRQVLFELMASADYNPATPPRAELLDTLTGHASEIKAIAFSPDGSHLASVDRDGALIVWDVDSGDILTQTDLPALNLVRALAYADDGNILVAGDNRETNDLLVWQSNAPDTLTTFSGHTAAIISAAFSPDTTLIASASADQTVRVWNLETGELLHTLEGHAQTVVHVAFSPDGQTLASAGRTLPVWLWDVATGEVLQSIGTGDTDSGNILNLVFSANGQQIATAHGEPDDLVQVWNVRDGARLHRLAGHTDDVLNVAFSPDLSLIASCGVDSTIRLWDAFSGIEVSVLTEHTNVVSRLAFSPDGARLASASWDGTINLWEIVTPDELVPDAAGSA